MNKAKPHSLPDLDDAEFVAKLRPLGNSVLPKSRHPDLISSGYSDTRHIEGLEKRKSRLLVAEHIEQIEKLRGPKRRFEYLIPVRVGDALAADAAQRGQSAATRLLEILRDSGYPVIPEDFIDLRKERGR